MCLFYFYMRACASDCFKSVVLGKGQRIRDKLEELERELSQRIELEKAADMLAGLSLYVAVCM